MITASQLLCTAIDYRRRRGFTHFSAVSPESLAQHDGCRGTNNALQITSIKLKRDAVWEARRRVSASRERATDVEQPRPRLSHAPSCARQPHNTYVTATGDVEQLMPFQEFAQGSPVAQLASEDGDPVAARNSFSAVSSPADTVATATPKI